MTGDGALALLIQVLVGVSLAACCGLRAFMPPFVFGLFVRLGMHELVLGRPVEIHPQFAWMSSTPALIVFGVAVAVELLADKFPAVDHVLDLVQTAVRPLAGALVVAASLSELDPLPAAVIGLVVGAPIAGGVHVTKAKARLLSSLGTGGVASPVLSVVEDGIALAGSVLAVTLAVLAGALVVIALALGYVLLRSLRRRISRQAPLKPDLAPR